MTERAGIDVFVNPTEAETGSSRARKAFDKATGSASRLERSNASLADSFRKMLGPIASVVSVTAGLTKLTRTTREFDILNAQLVTATGNADAAAVAFDAIEQFATRTPYQLNQSVEAFTKLVNLGLTPSQEALESYGDTSAAMGKDLMQFIEAVADAATAEFERLKEFGIRASNQGDTIAFTFRGTTSIVKNNAEEIEKYLISLGQNNFAGSMANRMATLDGAISNLGDSWDALFRAISDQGAGSLIEQTVRLGISALDELSTMIRSGELEAALGASVSSFDSWGSDVSDIVSQVDSIIVDTFNNWGVSADSTADIMSESFKRFPQNVRALIQIAAVEFGSFIDKADAYGKELKDKVNIFDGDSFDLGSELKRINQVRLDSIDAILEERDKSIASTDEQIVAAQKLRAEYDSTVAAKRKASSESDPLKGFKSGGQGELIELENQIRARQELELAMIQGFDSVKEQQEYDHKQRMAAIQLQYVGDSQKYFLELVKWEKLTGRQRAINALGVLTTMTQDLSTNSKKMFEISKALSITQTIISTYEGAQNAFTAMSKVPIVGPQLGIAAAAAAIAAGIARVNAIRKQSFNSGGSISSAGTYQGPSASSVGAPTVNTTQQNYSQQSATPAAAPVINIYGDVNGDNAVQIIEQIRDLVSNHDYTLIDVQSSNGQALSNAA